MVTNLPGVAPALLASFRNSSIEKMVMSRNSKAVAICPRSIDPTIIITKKVAVTDRVARLFTEMMLNDVFGSRNIGGGNINFPPRLSGKLNLSC